MTWKVKMIKHLFLQTMEDQPVFPSDADEFGDEFSPLFVPENQPTVIFAKEISIPFLPFIGMIYRDRTGYEEAFEDLIWDSLAGVWEAHCGFLQARNQDTHEHLTKTLELSGWEEEIDDGDGDPPIDLEREFL